MNADDARKLKEFLRGRAVELDKGNTVNPFAVDNRQWGSTQTGQYGSVDVNWEELDRAIDDFCAEFAKSART